MTSASRRNLRKTETEKDGVRGSGVSPPRMLAIRVLCAAESGRVRADNMISRLLARRSDLNRQDRALATELTLGTLCWRRKIDWILEHHLRRPIDKLEAPVRNILRMGVYQLRFLDRVPPYAVIDQSVEATKKLSGRAASSFVNAVLRSVNDRRKEEPLPDKDSDPAEYLSVVTSHPRWMVDRLIDLLGFDEAQALLEANDQKPPFFLRVNTLKVTRDELAGSLRPYFKTVEPSPYLPDSIRATGPKESISEMGLFRDGLFYVQDESSQLVSRLLSPVRGEIVLDACAAPGGKTTHIAQIMRNAGLIVAVDISRPRLEELENNCRRMGIGIVEAVHCDILSLNEGIWKERFHKILLDAPCASLGIIRRSPDIKWSKSSEDPAKMADTQLKLLKKVADMLKPGGVLVYSVCTYAREETVQVVEDFIRSRPDYEVNPPGPDKEVDWEIFRDGGYIRTWPHRHGMDGVFAVRLVRRGT